MEQLKNLTQIIKVFTFILALAVMAGCSGITGADIDAQDEERADIDRVEEPTISYDNEESEDVVMSKPEQEE